MPCALSSPRLYVNGKLAATITDSSEEPSSGPLTIGRARFDGGPVDWWNGAIQNVQVYDTALTAAQIQLLSSRLVTMAGG